MEGERKGKERYRSKKRMITALITLELNEAANTFAIIVIIIS